MASETNLAKQEKYSMWQTTALDERILLSGTEIARLSFPTEAKEKDSNEAKQ